MNVKTIYKNNREITYLSITGKVWFSIDSTYPIEIDEYLNREEKAYFTENTLSKYIYQKNNKTVIIDKPVFWAPIRNHSAINILREIATLLINCFPLASKIELSNDSPYIKVDGKIFDNIKQMFPEEDMRPKFVQICKENTEIPYDTYQKIWSSQPFPRKNHHTRSYFYALNNYFIEILAFGVVIYDATEIAKSKYPTYRILDRKYFIETPQASVSISNNKSFKIIKDYNAELRLFSPQKIPPNAYIIGKDPLFIQFTNKGVLITNGVFFAKEPLKEVRKPWYIVEKTEDGWDIFIRARTEYDGYYKISNNMLIKSRFNKHIEIQKGLIYADEYTRIYDMGDEIKIDYRKYKKDDLFGRYKVEIENGIIYVPKVYIKNIIL